MISLDSDRQDDCIWNLATTMYRQDTNAAKYHLHFAIALDFKMERMVELIRDAL